MSHWVGRGLSALAVLFLLFDSVTKLMRIPQVVQATAELGFPDSSIRLIGGLLLLCTIVYMIPRTAVLGAILLTGYLGGATAANLRINHPLFETLFPIFFAVLVWAAIFLREGRLHAVVPLRR